MADLVIYQIAQSLRHSDTLDIALAMDGADDLKDFRSRFSVPEHFHVSSSDSELSVPLYLCANSLGLMPLRAKQYVNEELDKWGTIGADGYFSGERPWVTMDEKVIPLMATIVGAKPSEVANMNTFTVNIHLMMIAFYKPTKKRFKIVVEDGLFCSVSHAIRSQIILHGLDPDQALIKVYAGTGQLLFKTEDMVTTIENHGSSIALVFLAGVHHYTGQFFNIPAITEAGRRVGAFVGWDLANAVGDVMLHLHDWDVDFACWCTYKYLNAGPGAVGGAFLHEKHHHADRKSAGLNGLDGWWGQNLVSKFKMGEVHDPIIGAQGFQLSTVPVLTETCLLASLEIFQEATMERIIAKQRHLTRYVEVLLREDYFSKHIEILTPADVHARGSQLFLNFDSTWPVKEIQSHLKTLGVICDTRESNVMVLGLAPLYNNFSDILKFFNLLRQVTLALQ